MRKVFELEEIYRDSQVGLIVGEIICVDGEAKDIKITYFNKTAADILNIPYDFSINDYYYEQLDTADRSWLGEYYNVIASGKCQSFYRQLRRNGKNIRQDCFGYKKNMIACFLRMDSGNSHELVHREERVAFQEMNQEEHHFYEFITQIAKCNWKDAAIDEEIVISSDGIKLWNQCLQALRVCQSVTEMMQFVLNEIGSYFEAEDGILALYGGMGPIAEWQVAKSNRLFEVIRKPSADAKQKWGECFKFCDHLLSREDDPKSLCLLRQYYESAGNGSIYLAPIFFGQTLGGIIVLRNIRARQEHITVLNGIVQITAKSLQTRMQQEHNMQLRYRDPLTGALNLDGFKQKGNHLLQTRVHQKHALAYCDVRRFKYINDTFGYSFGDVLLQHWMELCKSQLDEEEMVCRISGDILCLLVKYDKKEELVERFTRMVEKLNAFSPISDRALRVNLSCGVYLLEESDIYQPDINLMIDKAAMARKRENNFAESHIDFYSEEMRERALREGVITQQIRSSLKAGELYLNFQPQYDYAKGTIIGAEALVRWKHPKFGWISPGEFIPILEQSGLASDVDLFVWEETCRYLRTLIEDPAIDHVMPVSVNVSRSDIFQMDLCQVLPALTDQYGVERKMLKLEITESAYMENSACLIDVVNKLRALGFYIEMDDFGSGYSSLNSLKDICVDMLKLDIKLLANDTNSQRGGNILSSIIQMARWLEIPVIAEGVETREQAEYLRNLGCTYMQGYYFSRPVSPEEYREILHQSPMGMQPKQGLPKPMFSAAEFLDTRSKTSMLFNSYIGGASLLEYNGNNVEALLLNDMFYESFHISRERGEEYRLRMLDLFVEEDRGIIRESFQTAIASGSSVFEARVIQPGGGKERWIRSANRLISEVSGMNIIFSLVEDITQNREMRDQLESISKEFKEQFQGDGDITLSV